MRPDRSDRILVTGGRGFLGKSVCRSLQEAGYRDIVTPSRTEFDLSLQSDVERMFDTLRPAIVVHLAAVVGGIGINRLHPGTFFYQNAIMGLLVTEYARRRGVRKMVTVGTVCSYPRDTPTPFSESDLWNGYPEETNAPYGLAKRMLIVQADAYRREFGFNAVSVIPTNLYGPGDNYDPASSHVIPALIRRFHAARETGETEVTVWGDGSATREFLFVDDAADGIVRAMEHFNEDGPVNLGSGEEISISDLAHRIATLTGFTGSIAWDGSKPAGQPVRRVDSTRAAALFGFAPRVTLNEGLPLTVADYQKNLTEQPG